MLTLPESTRVDKRVPKLRFYDNAHVTSAERGVFVRQIQKVIWRCQLAPSTLNLAPGRRFPELEIFEVRLNQQNLDDAALSLIDRAIPYPIFFLLTFEGLCQACIAARGSDGAPGLHFRTEWVGSLTLNIAGLDVDAFYDSIIAQLAPPDAAEF